MTMDIIEIPDTEAGRKCAERLYDVLCNIAAKQLHKAQEATKALIPNAEIIEENAMCDGKYIALYALPDGKKKKVSYDYRTKRIEVINT